MAAVVDLTDLLVVKAAPLVVCEEIEVIFQSRHLKKPAPFFKTRSMICPVHLTIVGNCPEWQWLQTRLSLRLKLSWLIGLATLDQDPLFEKENYTDSFPVLRDHVAIMAAKFLKLEFTHSYLLACGFRLFVMQT